MWICLIELDFVATKLFSHWCNRLICRRVQSWILKGTISWPLLNAFECCTARTKSRNIVHWNLNRINCSPFSVAGSLGLSMRDNVIIASDTSEIDATIDPSCHRIYCQLIRWWNGKITDNTNSFSIHKQERNKIDENNINFIVPNESLFQPLEWADSRFQPRPS